MSKGWDNAILKKLKALTGKGLSTAEIGKRLGVSKNAIVGKLNRLGWNSKAGGINVRAAAASVKKTAAVRKTAMAKKMALAKKPAMTKPSATKNKPTAALVKKSKSASKNLAMHQRIIQHSLGMAGLKPDQCRWPIGDPDSENFHFCGCQVFVGKPYCYEHCKQAYQFTPPKKK
jgi:GcrA cell cycle regulator